MLMSKTVAVMVRRIMSEKMKKSLEKAVDKVERWIDRRNRRFGRLTFESANGLKISSFIAATRC